MAVVFTQVAVSTVATLVVPNIGAQGATFVLTNGDSTNKVFIGSGSAVTVSNGAVIPPYGIVSLQNCVSSNPVYAVAGTAVTLGVFYSDLR